MKVTVMRAVAMANGSVSGVDGQWLKSMDWTIEPGGEAEFTDDVARAMRFKDKAKALAYWKRTHPTCPWRPDGKPSRPLTALTVEIYEEEV